MYHWVQCHEIQNMTIFSFLGTTVINGSQSGMGRIVFHITQWGLRLKTSNLTIRDAPADLGGAFQCIGENNAGKVQTKLNLGMNNLVIFYGKAK